MKYNEQAIDLFRKHTKTASIDNYYQEAGLYINHASTLSDLGRDQEAIDYAEKAWAISRKNNFSSADSKIYGIICTSLTKQKKYKEAKKYVDKLTQLYENNQLDVIAKINYWEEKHTVYAALGNYKEAYLSHLKMVSFKDSINGIEQKNKISELSLKHESTQKEAKIKQFQQVKLLSETQRRLYLGINGFLLVLVVIAGLALRQIKRAKQKTDIANHQRDRLFSIVAHDLRSPVANLQHITSTISYVLKKNDPIIIKSLVNAIEESAVSLFKLVDNLLHWSLIQQGKTFSRPSGFALQPDIEDLMHTFKGRASLKRISILFQKDINPIIHSDRMAFQTILRNLLDNAIKFSPVEGVIHLQLLQTPTSTEIRITDSGNGIAIEVINILFDGDAPQKSRLGTEGEKGTGIGLYVCQELAKMNNAEIKLISSSEKGTVFALVYTH